MLELKNATKTFNPGTANEQLALDGLDLVLEDGGFLTVVGGNGSGKSTLLNTVAGVYPLDAGRILLDGEDLTRLPEHRRAAHIGRVFQDPLMGTAAGMTIEENMALAARRGKRRGLGRGITAADRDEYRGRLAVLGLGLEDRLSTRMGLLSGGQRQAVTLLMAALKKPKLLLLDEHTSALDPKIAAKVMELSDAIVRSHRLTTLMVTHNMRDAIRYGERLVMMQDGRVIFDVTGPAKQGLAVNDMLERFAV